jgi:hypothetical protein
MMPERADLAKVFEVTNLDILDLFGWQEAKGKSNNYSLSDPEPFVGEIEKQAGLAARTETENRNAFQRAVIRLRDALGLYIQLRNTVQPDDSPDFGKEIQALSPGPSTRRTRSPRPFASEYSQPQTRWAGRPMRQVEPWLQIALTLPVP